MNKLVAFFIERHKLGHLIFFMVVMLGLLSLQMIRYEITPKIDMGIVTVTTFKAGAGPEEVEMAITLVLEEELLKVDGVRKVFSRSMESLSLITLNLDPDFPDKPGLMNDIQKAVDRAQSRLPGDLLEKPLVEELGTDSLPVVELHVTGQVSEAVLRHQARLLQEELRTVPGVSGTERVGYRRPEMHIQVNPEQFLQLGISYDEVQQSLAGRNIRDSGGSITSLGREKAVLTVGQLEDPVDVADLIIRSREPGNAVVLRDVAQVLPGYEGWEMQVQTDGQLAIIVQVKKQETADELKTLAAIRALLTDIEPRLPEGVEIKLVNDVSRFTLEMLDTLTSNALMGLFSVFVILWLFLGRQLAFWVSTCLPFSILATFTLMLFYGFSVNSLTLMTLVLILGMLVDDAIVTGESIQARRESGMNPVQASIMGTRDIAAPVFVSALTTILAFLPLFFLGGLEGGFVRAVPAVVTMMLLSAQFESKFLLSAHLARSRFKTRERPWLAAMQKRYEKVIHLLLRHRKKSTLLLTVAFAAITVFSASVVRFQLYPETAIDTIHIQTELPNGTSLEQTSERIQQLEGTIRGLIAEEDLLNIVSQVGHHDTDIYGGSEGRNTAWALVTVYLKPNNYLSESAAVILNRLKTMGEQQTDFQMVRVEPLKDTPVMGKPVELEVMSDGADKFEVAEEVSHYLKTLPGVTEVWDSYTPGKDALDIEFNYHNLAAYQLSVKQVADAVRVAMDGLIINEQQLAMDRLYYRLRLPAEDQQQLSALQDLFIINGEGQAISLAAVADFRLKPGEADIRHFGGRRTVTVYAEIDRNVTDVGRVNQQLGAFLRSGDWGPDITFYQGGELEQQQASYGNLGIAFIACVFMILFVLMVLFNSFSQSLVVLSVLPFSITGVFLAFAVQGLPMSFLSIAGVLGLIGVLINDSVVMVHALNRQQHERDAEVIARLAATRFRPVFITSLTTLVALFPTAYGWGGDNPFITPMVMSMAWGVLFGMFISLLLLPCLFMLNDDLHDYISRNRGFFNTVSPGQSVT